MISFTLSVIFFHFNELDSIVYDPFFFFIPPVIQQVYIEHVLCAKNYPSCCEWN